MKSLFYLLFFPLHWVLLIGIEVELLFNEMKSGSGISKAEDSLGFIQKFYPTAKHKIRSPTGHWFYCTIPLSTISKNEDIFGNTPTSYLSNKEARKYFSFLEGECTRMRRPDFIWEFCHGKYIRQFDDETTFKVSKKKTLENYFLGFHPDYDLKRYSLVNVSEDYKTGRPQEYFHFKESKSKTKQSLSEKKPSHYFLNKTGSVLFSFGPVIRIRSDTYGFLVKFSKTSQDFDLRLSVWLPEDKIPEIEGVNQFYDPATGATTKERKRFDGVPYLKIMLWVGRVIDNSTLLLRETPLYDFTTSYFELEEIFNHTRKHLTKTGLISQPPIDIEGSFPLNLKEIKKGKLLL